MPAFRTRRGYWVPFSKSRLRRRAGRVLIDQAGASLIETVIAALILTIVSLGMVRFFAGGRVLFDQEEQKRVASLLAQEALESTLSRPYASIGAWSGERQIASVDYSIDVTVDRDVPESDIATIRCSVSWNVTEEAVRTTTLGTYVYDH